IWIILENFGFGRTAGKHVENVLDANTHSANTRSPAALAWIGCYSAKDFGIHTVHSITYEKRQKRDSYGACFDGGAAHSITVVFLPFRAQFLKQNAHFRLFCKWDDFFVVSPNICNIYAVPLKVMEIRLNHADSKIKPSHLNVPSGTILDNFRK